MTQKCSADIWLSVYFSPSYRNQSKAFLKARDSGVLRFRRNAVSDLVFLAVHKWRYDSKCKELEASESFLRRFIEKNPFSKTPAWNKENWTTKLHLKSFSCLHFFCVLRQSKRTLSTQKGAQSMATDTTHFQCATSHFRSLTGHGGQCSMKYRNCEISELSNEGRKFLS